MKRLQAFKYELRLSGIQVRDLYRMAGASRHVYNKALKLQISRYESGEKKLSYARLCKELTAWRNDPEYTWLKAAPSQALQQSLKDLDRAYQNFFAKRADFPRVKKRGGRDAFRFPQGIKLDQAHDRIFLPKLGWVRYRNSRQVVGEIGSVTISRVCDRWYVSIQTEMEVERPIHHSTTVVGIDVGVARLATLSDNTIYEAVRSFSANQVKLTRAQRRFSKKKKFGKNWKKALKKVGKIHRKIHNARQDYLHKTTTSISKNHAMVVVEDLQIKNMSKSAAGSKEARGRNVKAKSGLNKAILDQGWYEFRRQLEYKENWLGGRVVAVPARNTSRTCPECGHVSAENRPSQACFHCVSCGYENNADVVGAINILRAGHAQLACGESVQLGRSMNQEPAEVAQVFAA